MTIVTKAMIDQDSLDLRKRVMHIVSYQIRIAAKRENAPALSAAPYVLDICAGQWSEAIHSFFPDSKITGLAKAAAHESPNLSRWILGNIRDAAQTFEGHFDLLVGDGRAVAYYQVSALQLLQASLNLLSDGGWMALFVSMPSSKNLILSGRRHGKASILPTEIWVYTQSLITKPFALYLWQKGRIPQSTKIEWFE